MPQVKKKISLHSATSYVRVRLRTVPVAILWNVISSTTLTDQSWSLGPFLTFSFLFYQPCGPYLFPIFSGVSYFDLLAATLTGTLFFSHLSDSWFALGLLLFGEYTEFFSPPWVLFCLFFHLVEDVEGGQKSPNKQDQSKKEWTRLCSRYQLATTQSFYFGPRWKEMDTN